MTTEPPPESASPAIADGLAVAVTTIYAAAETAILATITLNIRAALAAADPLAAMLGSTRAVRTGTEQILDRMDGQARQVIPRVLAEAYGRGHRRTIDPELTVVEQAVRNVLERLGALRYGVFRWVTQLWNRLIATTSGQHDARAAADRVLQQAAGRGITGYVDPHGRRWGLTGYVDQAVQHAAGNAGIDGFLHRVTDGGGDLVIVTESAHPCPLCNPWEHRVLSISGNDPERPSMATARREGLFHPRCHHTIVAWRPGFVWPPHSIVNEPGTYEATQRQRDIERHIREWKRRQAAALDDVTRMKATAKVRFWQAEMRKHLAAEGLRRSRQRERTDYGHTRPLKHAHG